MSSLTEYSHRKLVTALSYHIVYGEWASTALWVASYLLPLSVFQTSPALPASCPQPWWPSCCSTGTERCCAFLSCLTCSPSPSYLYSMSPPLSQGVTVADLVASYTELEKMAQSHGRYDMWLLSGAASLTRRSPPTSCRAVSFSGGSSEAVHYALHHIHHLVTVDHTPCQQPVNGVIASGDQKLRPLLELPHVFDLYHQSNQIAPLFALEAIVGASTKHASL